VNARFGIRQLDYDQLVLLDAETLAEGRIREAYEALHPQLRHHLSAPGDIDDRAPQYAVRYGGREYVIYSPELDDNSWGRATYAFFSIIDDQLTTSTHRFYAINGGMILAGCF
jgi:hypothetical protein